MKAQELWHNNVLRKFSLCLAKVVVCYEWDRWRVYRSGGSLSTKKPLIFLNIIRVGDSDIFSFTAI